ncbi:hypothetical protein [Nocardia sp. NPDC050413]|uniref:hypothetical protein n=1 Tax=Nocardia sp. NPDC050413 TaxID=3155784 RepID=UPI0033D4B3C1
MRSEAAFEALDEPLSHDAGMVEHLSAAEIGARTSQARPTASASFVTPCPTELTILVPSQEVSRDILNFMDALGTKEIHGLDPSCGLQPLCAAAVGA